ncbi:MAG TPA: Flp family type IVb pilin [Thermomicrobiales bacterium]|nr:Flp family type IVb pilin [Thermomicrobiales bacterium]
MCTRAKSMAGGVQPYFRDAVRKVILSEGKREQTANIRPLRYPDGANQWGIAERTAVEAAMFVRWAQEDIAMVPYVIAWVLDQVEREEEGQGLVEYALILVLVSIAAIVALTTLGSKLSPLFNKVSSALTF